jgi:hypothetical protein
MHFYTSTDIMVYKAKSGLGGQRVESLLLQTTGGDDENGGMRDSAQLVVDSDGSDEHDDMKKQRHIRVVGEIKVHEDLDPKGDPSQLTCACPSKMPSHISLGMPVTHKTAKDLTPAFVRDVSHPIHLHFSSKVLDVRSDQICTGSVMISFFIHILFI